MKRLDILVAICVIVGLLTFIWFWKSPDWRQGQEEPISNVSINPNAKIADNGNPLPARSNEDVIVSIQSNFQQPEVFRYDFETGNWQIVNLRNIFVEKIRWFDNRYFIFNNPEGIWDEIERSLLDKDFPLLGIEKDPLFYFLPTDQLENINANLEPSFDEDCRQNRICAVWYLKNDTTKSVAIIRVDKLSRKMVDIALITEDDNLLIRYDYRPVEINRPSPVRFLLDSQDQ